MSRVSPFSDVEQYQILLQIVQPQPGEPRVDPSALDAARFTGGRYAVVLALQEGQAPTDALRHLPPNELHALNALMVGDDGQLKPPLSALTAADILTTEWPEPRWVVPTMLCEGLGILAGRPKIGKSWLALQVACAVATGGRVFDKDVEAGPVLYLALEDSPRRLQSRMRALGWGNNNPGDADFLTLTEFLDQIGPLNAGGAEVLARQIRARRYRLAVIDTLSRSIRGDQNDADVMTAALSPLQGVALDCGCALVFVDHHRKANMTGADPILDIGGSVSKGGVADTVWAIYKEQGKAGAVLHIVGRDIDERRLQLRHDQETHCWQSMGDVERVLTAAEQDVYDAALDLGRFQLMEAVEALGKDGAEKGHIHGRLQELVNKGYLSRSTEGRLVYYEVV